MDKNVQLHKIYFKTHLWLAKWRFIQIRVSWKDFQRILKLMTAGLLMNYTYLFSSDWAYKETYLFWYCNFTWENLQSAERGFWWSNKKEKKRWEYLQLNKFILNTSFFLWNHYIKLRTNDNCLLLRLRKIKTWF